MHSTTYHDDERAVVAELVDVRALRDLVPRHAGVTTQVRVHLRVDIRMGAHVRGRMLG